MCRIGTVPVWYEFAATGNTDYSTGTGKSIIPVEYDMLTRHYGQFNIICRQRKYGLLNRLGEWVRPLVYDAILPINQRGNNRFACIRRGKTEFL